MNVYSVLQLIGMAIEILGAFMLSAEARPSPNQAMQRTAGRSAF